MRVKGGEGRMHEEHGGAGAVPDNDLSSPHSLAPLVTIALIMQVGPGKSIKRVSCTVMSHSNFSGRPQGKACPPPEACSPNPPFPYHDGYK